MVKRLGKQTESPRKQNSPNGFPVIMTEGKNMTKTRKSTKIAAFILTLAMFCSMFCIIGATHAGAATQRVSMYSSNVSFAKYGAATYEVFVKTNDAASDQQVYVHYNYMDNMAWKDSKASYVATLDDGSKIWKAVFSSFNTRYAIKYVADGETFWDNNNGKDYTGADVIGSAPVASERLGYQYDKANYQINAVLQNYAYNKSVFVRYTTDGWKTFDDQALIYNKTNANGTETWTSKLDLANYSNVDDFQYAICYSVYGTEYWANNFGENYNGMYYIHH